MEPEVGRGPEICFPDTGSVGEYAFDDLTIYSLTPLRIKKHLISIKSFFDQNPFSHHTSSVFLFLSLIQVGRFFHQWYLWSFGFLPPFPHHVLEVFHWLIFLFGFLPQSPITRLGSFSPATWSFKTYQLLYRARVFLLLTGFSSSVSLIGLGGFSPGSHSKFLFKVPIQGFH